jgi:hypothetical protein
MRKTFVNLPHSGSTTYDHLVGEELFRNKNIRSRDNLCFIRWKACRAHSSANECPSIFFVTRKSGRQPTLAGRLYERRKTSSHPKANTEVRVVNYERTNHPAEQVGRGLCLGFTSREAGGCIASPIARRTANPTSGRANSTGLSGVGCAGGWGRFSGWRALRHTRANVHKIPYVRTCSLPPRGVS